MTPEPTERDMEAARQLADGLNLSGWRREPDHGCDGTEEVCAVTCPIAVQVEVDPKEIAQGIAERIAQARREGAADALDEAADDFAVIPHPYEGGVTAWLRNRAAVLRDEPTP